MDGVRIPGIMRASNKRVTLGLDCDSSSTDAFVDSIVTRVILPCEMSSTGRQPLARFNQKTKGERPENVPSTVKCATGGNAAGAGVRTRLAHARTQRPPPAGPKLRQESARSTPSKNSSSSSTAARPLRGTAASPEHRGRQLIRLTTGSETGGCVPTLLERQTRPVY